MFLGSAYPYLIQLIMAISFILSESIIDSKKALEQLYDHLPDTVILLEETTSDDQNDTQADFISVDYKIEYCNNQAHRLFKRKIDAGFI